MYAFPPIRIFDYSAGFALGKYFNKLQKNSGGGYIRYINFYEIMGVLLISIQLIISPYINEGFRRVAFHILFALYTVYIYALNNGIVSKILTNKVIVKMGNESFYYYIAHVVYLRYLYNILEFLPIKMNTWYTWKGWIPVLSCFFILTFSSFIFSKIKNK